jgi:cysteine synthase A
MEAVQNGTHILVDRLGVPSAAAHELVGKLGPSGVCNIIGAIKTAKYLGLGPEDNVVTIATDSYDRYPSVSRALYERAGSKPDDDTLEMWAKSAFLGASLGEIMDLSVPGRHDRLQRMKIDLWTRFGYDEATIRQMAGQAFWDAEYAKIQEIDPLIAQARGALPVAA